MDYEAELLSEAMTALAEHTCLRSDIIELCRLAMDKIEDMGKSILFHCC